MEIRLAEATGEHISKCYEQSYHNDEEQTVAPSVVPNDGIKQAHKQRNPRGCLGDSHHDAIKEEGRRTIQCHKEFLVPLDNLFYHIIYS
jgi:hypothetical protein